MVTTHTHRIMPAHCFCCWSVCVLCTDVYMVKWSDQSHYRGLFFMEFYVLGNEWDYSAVNPDDAVKTPPKSSNVSVTCRCCACAGCAMQ